MSRTQLQCVCCACSVAVLLCHALHQVQSLLYPLLLIWLPITVGLVLRGDVIYKYELRMCVRAALRCYVCLCGTWHLLPMHCVPARIRHGMWHS